VKKSLTRGAFCGDRPRNSEIVATFPIYTPIYYSSRNYTSMMIQTFNPQNVISTEGRNLIRLRQGKIPRFARNDRTRTHSGEDSYVPQEKE